MRTTPMEVRLVEGISLVVLGMAGLTVVVMG